LTKLDNALKIIVEDVLVLHVQSAFFKAILITLNHGEDDLLIVSWALEEVLKESLSLDFFLALLHVVDTGRILLVFVIIILGFAGCLAHFQVHLSGA